MNEVKNSCIDCPHHETVMDPDPYDSFCIDDLAMLCKKAEPTPEDLTRNHDGAKFPYRPIQVSIRPTQVRNDTPIPDWCPLR